MDVTLQNKHEHIKEWSTNFTCARLVTSQNMTSSNFCTCLLCQDGSQKHHQAGLDVFEGTTKINCDICMTHDRCLALSKKTNETRITGQYGGRNKSTDDGYIPFNLPKRVKTTILQYNGKDLHKIQPNSFPVLTHIRNGTTSLKTTAANTALDLTRYPSAPGYFSRLLHSEDGDVSSVQGVTAFPKACTRPKKRFDFSRLAESALEKDDMTASGPTMNSSVHTSAPHWKKRYISREIRRKYLCRFCSRHFTKSYNRKIHERTHTDERPFFCEVCRKGFRRKDHLRDHRYTHLSQRPFRCEFCEKSFCQARTLTVHTSTHHTTEAARKKHKQTP